MHWRPSDWINTWQGKEHKVLELGADLMFEEIHDKILLVDEQSRKKLWGDKFFRKEVMTWIKESW